MIEKLTVLMVVCDTYLAGAFARRFERDGWNVVTVTSVKDAEHIAVRLRPSALLLHTACTRDVAAEVKRLRALPTLRRTKVVLLDDGAHMHGVSTALTAGAADVLFIGHVVPSDMVTRVRQLVGV